MINIRRCLGPAYYAMRNLAPAQGPTIWRNGQIVFNPGWGTDRFGAILRLNSETLLVGRDNGTIWKSTNSGKTFTQISTISAGKIVVRLYAFTPLQLLGRVGEGTAVQTIYLSSNGGYTWTNGVLPDTYNYGMFDILVEKTGIGIMVGKKGTDPSRLLRTTDYGQNWVNSGTALITTPSAVTNFQTITK